MGVELYFHKGPTMDDAALDGGNGDDAEGNSAAAGVAAAEDQLELDCYSGLRWATTRDEKHRLIDCGLGLRDEPYYPEELVAGARAVLRQLFSEAVGSDPELRAMLLEGNAQPEDEERVRMYESLGRGPREIESAEAWAAAGEVVRGHDKEGDWISFLDYVIGRGLAGYSATWDY